ncbi:hypothetical protein CBS147339_8494 [Penicillium roqueforti]|nr:hypothetical protein CBS147339_8494 [Penicillium roqueforti]KAI3090538.1 hypothetical protein CBS147338_8857 [Penicillium roqueforti]KAI3129932.1 hypothetical protein CBS147325_9451 [Penicillium roqueforti]KAI3152966.1 hypothetical protein DTO046C5_8886 [Penicillium roqueforti]KAI3180753.1 hypothetical protein DTO032C6_8125 [Penicillium roqueforti]
MNAISGGGAQMSLIDVLFPGFSMASASAQQLLAGNLDSYTRLLYEALIRPGRADKKVYFQLADKKISTQLFHMVFKQTADHKGSKHECGDKAIERLANNFTSKVPDQVFSPTEVLSFLLEQKNSPFSAVTSVEN